MIDDGEITSGLTVTVSAIPLVDRTEVIQHFVRLRDLVLQITQHSRGLVRGPSLANHESMTGRREVCLRVGRLLPNALVVIHSRLSGLSSIRKQSSTFNLLGF